MIISKNQQKQHIPDVDTASPISEITALVHLTSPLSHYGHCSHDQFCVGSDQLHADPPHVCITCFSIPVPGLSCCSVQFSSVTHSCLTLGNSMDCSTPGFPVHHQLPELVQTHVHLVSDAIQPS